MTHGQIILPSHPMTMTGDYLILGHADLDATDYIAIDGEPLFPGDYRHCRGSAVIHGPGLALAWMLISNTELASEYRQ